MRCPKNPRRYGSRPATTKPKLAICTPLTLILLYTPGTTPFQSWFLRRCRSGPATTKPKLRICTLVTSNSQAGMNILCSSVAVCVPLSERILQANFKENFTRLCDRFWIVALFLCCWCLWGGWTFDMLLQTTRRAIKSNGDFWTFKALQPANHVKLSRSVTLETAWCITMHHDMLCRKDPTAACDKRRYLFWDPLSLASCKSEHPVLSGSPVHGILANDVSCYAESICTQYELWSVAVIALMGQVVLLELCQPHHSHPHVPGT